MGCQFYGCPRCICIENNEPETYVVFPKHIYDYNVILYESNVRHKQKRRDQEVRRRAKQKERAKNEKSKVNTNK